MSNHFCGIIGLDGGVRFFSKALLVQILEHQYRVAHLLALALFLLRQAFDETRALVEVQHRFLIHGIDGQETHGKRRGGDNTADHQVNECLADTTALEFGHYGELGDLDGRVVADRHIKGKTQVGTLATAQMYRVGRQAEIGDRDVVSSTNTTTVLVRPCPS